MDHLLKSIRYILTFSIIVFLQGSLYILSPVHVYIQALDPQMNTSAIYNMAYRVKIRVRFSLLS
jgi:hypothetical protein